MDALILSCGTGGGHNAAASAVAEELTRRGHRATMLNPYTLYSNGLAEKINNFYIKPVQKAPAAFGAATVQDSYTDVCLFTLLCILPITVWSLAWKST